MIWEADDQETQEWQDAQERLVTGNLTEDDLEADHSLRPRLLRDYLGQVRVKENLGLLIDAAKDRHEPLDHVLLSGPPGLGRPPWPPLWQTNLAWT